MRNFESNRRFFAHEAEIANESVMNFDGGAVAENQIGDQFYLGADAKPVAPTATPYIFTVQNTNGTAVNDVELINAGEQFGNSAGNYGLPAGVNVSYDIPGISYNQFLAFLFTTNVLIGKIYIESSDTATLTSALKLETYDVLGADGSKAHSPVIDPYQNQTGVMIWEHRFTLNQFTKFIIGSIAVNASVTYRFYPMAEGLKTRSKEFGNPMIEKVPVRAIPNTL